MKKNDNLGTLHSTGETKVGGIDDMEVNRFLKKEANKKEEEKEES